MYCYLIKSLSIFSEPELAIKALGEIQHISKPVGISFQEMLKLMNDCKELEEAEQARYKDEHNHSYTETKMEARGILANNPFTLLSGIIPGKFRVTSTSKFSTVIFCF